MIWQDFVFAASNVIFGYALIPQIYQGFKEKKTTITIQTSLITALVIYAISISFATLGMYFASIANLISGTMWAVLLIQKLIYG